MRCARLRKAEGGSLWAIITCMFEIAAAVRLRKIIDNEWLLIVSGIVSILFGILLLVFPGPGALSVVWLIGLYALLFGILALVLSFRLRGMRDTSGRQAARGVAQSAFHRGIWLRCVR